MRMAWFKLGSSLHFSWARKAFPASVRCGRVVWHGWQKWRGVGLLVHKWSWPKGDICNDLDHVVKGEEEQRVAWLGWDAEGCRNTADDQRWPSLGQNSLFKNQYGHIFDLCPPSVWWIGRKKIIFEFCQNNLWVKCHNYLTSHGGIGLQNGFCLMKFKCEVILVLLIYCHFAFLLWKFESELAMVANIKVVHFYLFFDTV